MKRPAEDINPYKQPRGDGGAQSSAAVDGLVVQRCEEYNGVEDYRNAFRESP